MSNRRTTVITALAGLSLLLQAPQAAAKSPVEVQADEMVAGQGEIKSITPERRERFNYGTYILGPGDIIQIELLDLPELSGVFSIGPDGTVFLPRLRAVYIEGLTLEELRVFLTKQFNAFVIDPQLYVRPVVYRPVRVYLSGEVKRPGYYTIKGMDGHGSSVPNYTSSSASVGPSNLSKVQSERFTTPFYKQSSDNGREGLMSTAGKQFVLPTVFDAIRTAQGITPYSDLSKVQVTRRRAESLGGGHVRTNLNFLSLITEGNESQNIRLFDGDVVNVGKSDMVMREQLLKAGQTNLSPRFMNVFVGGRVKYPGGVVAPQGTSMNQAISLAGGPKLLRGKVEFIRFTSDGEVNRRVFSYKPSAAANTPNNPILTSGDLIAIRDSPFSATATILDELTTPFVGIYSAYSLFENFK